jgi:hypothetical protein
MISSDSLEYKTLKKRTHKRISRIENGIIAIDGEGESDPCVSCGRIDVDTLAELDACGMHAPSHRYTLLATSEAKYISGQDLGTKQCLDFLLDQDGNKLCVMFSFNYDVTMMLRDIPREQMVTMWETGECEWEGYSLFYLPSRMFQITRGEQAILIYDVFGFYQAAFVKALEEWKIGTEEQQQRIAEMKQQRGNFLDVDNAAILAYCLEECELLVKLVEKLAKAINFLEVPMKKWYGAGALAGALLTKYQTKQFKARHPEEMETAIMSAYFGGRFEIALGGKFDPVYTYDIRSAYPTVASQLPCLKCGDWYKMDEYYLDCYGVWLVEWNIEDCTWPPFPVRTEKGNVYYPLEGKGWYWQDEIAAALELYPDSIKVLEGYVYGVECDHKPFKFVPELFEYRKQLKAEKNEAQLTIKLGLNSLYGKCAQAKGRRNEHQSFIWAGMITSGCRAMILRAIRLNPEAIIAIHTDGIISTEPLDLDIGENLGQWEADTADWGFLLQPGIYQLAKGPYRYLTLDEIEQDQKALKRIKFKTRGFGRKDLDFGGVQKAFEADPIYGHYDYMVTRFVTLGGALQHGAHYKDYLARWVTARRKINFHPARRMPPTDALRLDSDSVSLPPGSNPTVRYLPPTSAPVDVSQPFKPGGSYQDDGNAGVTWLATE